jgi:hypothetical protein
MDGPFFFSSFYQGPRMALKVKKAAPPPPPQPQYCFRPGFRSPVSPDAVVARVAYLRDILGRAPNGADILEDARPVGSPLHEHFEWDDAEAAEAHRLSQARELVASIRVTVVKHDEDDRLKPVFISSTAETGKRGFITVAVATAPPLREHTLADIIRKYWTATSRERGLGYEELDPLFDLIDELYEEHCK